MHINHAAHTISENCDELSIKSVLKQSTQKFVKVLKFCLNVCDYHASPTFYLDLYWQKVMSMKLKVFIPSSSEQPKPSTLKMKAAITCKMLTSTYQSTQSHSIQSHSKYSAQQEIHHRTNECTKKLISILESDIQLITLILLPFWFLISVFYMDILDAG